MRSSHPFVLNGFVALVMILLLTYAPESIAQPLNGPRLTMPSWTAHAESFEISGDDPGAPRDLVLWAWRNETFERIATTRSNEQGRFEFGQIPVPLSGLLLGVAPVGSHPRIDGLLHIERSIPAPGLSMLPGDLDGVILIHPIGFEGELRIRDAATGRLLVRLPIDTARRDGLTINLSELLAPSPPEAILIRQVLDEGRQSPSVYYRFAPLD